LIEKVFSLKKDGNEQPQFFALTLKYANQGAGYRRTIIYGTEAHLRGLLRDGGIAAPIIDDLFRNVR
jgi:hypothetical protein